MTWFLVAVGGAAGAVLRFVVDTAVTRWVGGRWPWGTLVVNVTGSALLGFLVGLGPGRHAWALLATGLCGAFTTASTFAWEVLELASRRRVAAATAYVAFSAGLALAALVLGRHLGA